MRCVHSNACPMRAVHVEKNKQNPSCPSTRSFLSGSYLVEGMTHIHFQVAICFAFKSWLNDMLNLDLMKKPIFPGRERRFFHINSSKRTKFLRISVRIFHTKLFFIADSVMEVEVFVSHVTLYLYSVRSQLSVSKPVCTRCPTSQSGDTRTKTVTAYQLCAFGAYLDFFQINMEDNRCCNLKRKIIMREYFPNILN